MRNLYERKVRYSFVETKSVAASSQDEADAKFDEMMKNEKLAPVGCSYGDLETEILSNVCVFKDEGK